MLQFLPAPIKGSFNSIALAINTVALSTPIFALAVLKLIPHTGWRKACSLGCIRMAETWISINDALMNLTHQTRYHVSGGEDLRYDGWYMVVSNHQSWADIFVLQKLLNHRIPFLKFFLKKELIYVPVIGITWWALDFPFMHRHGKEYLARHPEMKGKDLEVTRKACEKFRHTPVSIMNFLEGTRFTPAKHARQQSPYHHLLKPKSAGIAYALNIMNEQIDTMVDVTIHYRNGRPTFWEFMCGRTDEVDVHIQTRPIPQYLKQGDYENDREFRVEFQSWVNSLWKEKDARLEQMSQNAQIGVNP